MKRKTILNILLIQLKLKIQFIQLRLLDYISSCIETIEISHPYLILDRSEKIIMIYLFLSFQKQDKNADPSLREMFC